jgi:hypothetical protein
MRSFYDAVEVVISVRAYLVQICAVLLVARSCRNGGQHVTGLTLDLHVAHGLEDV